MSAYGYRKTYRLKGRWSVEFILNEGSLDCRWSPRMPTGKLCRSLLPRYRSARNEFLGSLDLTTLVVEL
ncbi:hypothetical protein AAG612_03100 [Citromicrobium bathyomarinum]|uniref:hypothetical protein n=1 Tax=Citromicrobium bathyomarinum TaxID=72174 RepID=UPI00315A66FC